MSETSLAIALETYLGKRPELFCAGAIFFLLCTHFIAKSLDSTGSTETLTHHSAMVEI